MFQLSGRQGQTYLLLPNPLLDPQFCNQYPWKNNYWSHYYILLEIYNKIIFCLERLHTRKIIINNLIFIPLVKQGIHLQQMKQEITPRINRPRQAPMYTIIEFSHIHILRYPTPIFTGVPIWP